MTIKMKNVRRDVKKAVKTNVDKTKERVSHAFSQARDSLKVLEMLEKEAMSKARALVKNPIPASQLLMANETIAASLKKLGIASQTEVDALRDRLARLESRLDSEPRHDATIPG